MKPGQLLNSLWIAGTLSALIAQPVWAQAIQVTGVQLNPKPNGLEVILQTTNGATPRIFTSTSNQTVVADIANAQLRLPSGNEFRASNPVQGIAEVTVTNLNANSIQLRVTGKAGAPKVEVFESDREGLIFSLTPAPQTAEMPTAPTPQTPEEEPQDEPVEEPETPDQQPKPAQEPEEIGAEEQEEIVVTAEGEEGYQVEDAATATRTETPLRDIPQSIQVIPRQVLEERQVIRLQEIADNVPGVQAQPYGEGSLPNTAGFIIRGFPNNANTYRDGFRDFGFINPFDVANIERIEILKGPASVLYGQNPPGGLVNITSKKPLSEPFYNPSLTVGSYEFFRPTLDISGPLNSQETLAYRLNLAYEDAGSFRDFVDSTTYFAAPALTWRIGEDTTLTFNSEYQKYDYVYDDGLLPEPESFRVPISRFLGEPDFNDGSIDAGRASYVLEHQLSEDWELRHGFAAVLGHAEGARIGPDALEDDRRTVTRAASLRDSRSQNYTLQNEVLGRFNTGSVEHRVLLGAEFYRERFSYEFLRAPIDPIDLFDPVYGARPGEFEKTDDVEYGTEGVGLYFQDQIALLSNLKLLLGGRFDLTRTKYEDRLNDQVTRETPSAFSPRAGIVYQPIEPVSLYFSYAKSFDPSTAIFGISATGETFEPERGEQFEVGIKTDLLEGRLSATLALYEITRENVLVTDPGDRDYSIQTGEQKSRGIELDLRATPVDGWNIIATYAYTDAFVSEDTTIPVEDTLVGVPRHQVGLFTTYEIQTGALQGLGFGLGLYYVSEREATLPNTDVELPSYFRVDASAFYRRNNWKVQLNVKNLTDIEFYNTQGFYVVPQPPLTILGTVSVEF